MGLLKVSSEIYHFTTHAKSSKRSKWAGVVGNSLGGKWRQVHLNYNKKRLKKERNHQKNKTQL